MTQRLKRWESPRRQGRNDKGKGGSARARQLKKQTQMLRKQLKESEKADDQNKQKKNQNKQKGRDTSSLPLFFWMSSPRLFLLDGCTHSTEPGVLFRASVLSFQKPLVNQSDRSVKKTSGTSRGRGIPLRRTRAKTCHLS